MAYYYYEWTRKADYDLNLVTSLNAYNLCDRRYAEIHTTIPRKSDIINGQAWTYPHITFVDNRGNSDRLYIGWDNYRNRIPQDKLGYRIQLSAGEWTLFHNICSDMTEYYSYI